MSFLGRLPHWVAGIGLAGLLFGIYVMAWGTVARSMYIQFVAAPVVQHAAPADASVNVSGRGRVLRITSKTDDRTVSHTAPAGVRFLLPALFLALIAPTRFDWLVLWAGHCGLALVALAALASGLAGLDAGFVVGDFVTQYVVDAFSLGVAVVAVLREFELGPAITRDPSSQ